MLSAEVGQRMLLCRVGALVCAIPLENVAEVMRPLSLESVGKMPEFVAGVSVIRGAAVPVVDLAKLLGDARQTRKARLVLVKMAGRSVALALDAVIGIRALQAELTKELPPLLRDASADVIASVGSLDARLLVVLSSTRLLPESAWADLRVHEAEA